MESEPRYMISRKDKAAVMEALKGMDCQYDEEISGILKVSVVLVQAQVPDATVKALEGTMLGLEEIMFAGIKHFVEYMDMGKYMQGKQ